LVVPEAPPEPVVPVAALELLLVIELLVLEAPPEPAVPLLHMPMALVVELHTSPVGQPLPAVPRQPGSQSWVAVLQTCPLIEPPQSESCEQPGPQVPVGVLQMGPPGSVAQSALLAHLPQLPMVGPAVKQCGAPACVQGSLVVTPRSPSQGTQVELVASQTGVPAVHAALFVAVHWTQVFVVALHAGLAPEHWPSITQATQTPWFGPCVAQRVDRHTTSPFAAVQGPSPLA
jgi:hypothetical protein